MTIQCGHCGQINILPNGRFEAPCLHCGNHLLAPSPRGTRYYSCIPFVFAVAAETDVAYFCGHCQLYHTTTNAVVTSINGQSVYQAETVPNYVPAGFMNRVISLQQENHQAEMEVVRQANYIEDLKREGSLRKIFKEKIEKSLIESKKENRELLNSLNQAGAQHRYELAKSKAVSENLMAQLLQYEKEVQEAQQSKEVATEGLILQLQEKDREITALKDDSEKRIYEKGLLTANNELRKKHDMDKVRMWKMQKELDSFKKRDKILCEVRKERDQVESDKNIIGSVGELPQDQPSQEDLQTQLFLKQREIKSLKVEKEKSRKALNDMKKGFHKKEMETEKMDLQNTIDQLQKDLKALEEQAQKMTTELTSLRQMDASKEKTINGMVKDLYKFRGEAQHLHQLAEQREKERQKEMLHLEAYQQNMKAFEEQRAKMVIETESLKEELQKKELEIVDLKEQKEKSDSAVEKETIQEETGLMSKVKEAKACSDLKKAKNELKKKEKELAMMKKMAGRKLQWQDDANLLNQVVTDDLSAQLLALILDAENSDVNAAEAPTVTTDGSGGESGEIETESDPCDDILPAGALTENYAYLVDDEPNSEEMMTDEDVDEV